MNHQTFTAFSIRRLNPFRGVLQVLLGDRARALSGNGRVWEIQVLSDKPRGLWASMPIHESLFYTLGLWSAEEGLHRVSLNPLFNQRDMVASGESLIEALDPVQKQLPFPLADPYEAWLLDEKSGQPFALLQSSRSEGEREQIEPGKWLAAQRGDFGFVSQHLLNRGLPLNDGHNPRVHASLLEAMVRERAGQQQCFLWYHRHADGSASACDDPAAHLAADRFPELPISEHWPVENESALVADYIRWRAPQLLLLPGLRHTTRDRLERLAANQAEAVDRLWRLYPAICNENLLNRARVEARIRTANRK
ncbi:MAG: hypothetical protein P8166_06565 [Candidatus Thiodiazotropha sp.]|jgi:hypothetical protein